MQRLKRFIDLKAALFGFLLLGGCTVDSAERRYILAEKLWTDGKYSAAVSEFEKVAQKDPKGKLGVLALRRGATTQTLFLSQYPEALQKLKQFVEISQDPAAVWSVRKEIGDLLFGKMERYDQALHYYQRLLDLRPNTPERAEFSFRIAKCFYFLGHFDEALTTYRQMLRLYSGTPYAEKAAFEVGQTLLAQGEQEGGSRKSQELFKQAMAAFEGFLKSYPKSSRAPEAAFEIGECYEALDQLDAAHQAYLSLRNTYPSRNVIEIKLARIQERKAQRSH